MFELLAPAFAALGLAAAAVPFWLHRFRRTPAQHMAFSTVRFLKPTLPLQTRRSHVEHWPLLLLRMIALCLIGLAFSRPFRNSAVSRAAEAMEHRQRVAVLVDCSASMRREGIREVVEKQLRQVVQGLNDQDRLSILTFSRATRMILSADEWSRTSPDQRQPLIEHAVSLCEPDWMETRTGVALLEAARQVSSESAGQAEVQRRIVLITDFQRGSQLAELKSEAWPAGVQVDLRIVQPTITGNAGLSLVSDARDNLQRVRVTVSADAAVTDFEIQPFDLSGAPVGKPLSAATPAGQRRTFVVPMDEATASTVAGVELKPDPHPFDNVVDLPIADAPSMQLGFVGTTDVNDAESMRYYLQRVLDGDDSQSCEIIDLVQSDGRITQVPETVRMVVVTDVVPETLWSSIVTCLDRQGVVLVAIRTPAVLESLSSLLPEPLPCAEAQVQDYTMLSRIDFSSPLFDSFSAPQFADFSSIRFWHHRTLTLPENSTVYETVARFDSGAPAILQTTTPAGGRWILLAAGWQPEDSQWAMSSRFPPMLNSLFRKFNIRAADHLVQTVGDFIRPAELLGSPTWNLTLPDGTTRHSIAEAETGQSIGTMTTAENHIQLSQPGRYILAVSPASPGLEKTIAIIAGMAASESRTEPLPQGQLRALGVDGDVVQAGSNTIVLSSTAAADIPKNGVMNSVELESSQKLWQWLLLAGLIVLFIECGVAGRLARRRLQENVA